MVTLINSSGPDPLPTPKQIRFVNNQGQPPTKRRRINAACLTCRRRKTRCAGEHPTCSTCTKNGHVCLGYSDGIEKSISKKEPGRRPDGTNFDIDEDEYADEEPEVDRKQWKNGKNGIKQFDMPDDSPKSSRRTSEPEQDRVKLDIQLKSENIDWEEPSSQPTPRPEPLRRPINPRNPSFSTEGGHSETGHSPVQYHNESHRVPYFRYFGPTAIVPGFKQMVVKVRDRRRSSISATSPSGASSIFSGLMTSMQQDVELGHLDDMPIYDPTDTNDVHPLIIQLVDTFFIHLGSNYPFLRREKFPKLVQEKRVEPILVDAVCALAARFSDNPLFRRWNEGKLAKSEYGYIYAQRAKSATVDTFPCPSVAAVQACLLMAYDGFGADQDSALWMYLGIAIRMAVDLGLSKEDGVRYQGERDPWYARGYNRKEGDDFVQPSQVGADGNVLTPEEQKEVEQERIDTFWAVFFLDRAISSGTGRPVTLKDDDFELELPKSSIDPVSGWPDPLASLLQIIHLYGRVSDVLNNITHAQDLTQDKLNKLSHMESELTRLHQRTDPRLRFDANNFQAHVKNGQGTTFILLHFWFHALIIVLHQPTLLTKEGTINRSHQLKPHSRELSMSSAKTIADILAFAELLDPKCFIGNPFTSQPIYIAACAFIKESKSSMSQPASRDTSPSPDAKGHANKAHPVTIDPGPASRHLLLASAANQNYQACYKALKQMHTYWGGVRYILTALDQKLDGQWDCETYTIEEYESARRYRQSSAIARFAKQFEYPSSPIPDNGPPLAWSLTGTTNSPNSSLTLLFQNPVNPNGAMPTQVLQSTVPTSAAPTSAPTPPGNMIYDPIRQSLPETTASIYHPAYPQPATSAMRHSINRSRRVSGGSGAQGKSSYLRYESMSSQDDLNKPNSSQVTLSVAPTSYTPSSQQSYEQSGGSGYPTNGSPASSTQSQNMSTSSTSDGPSNFAQSGSGLASSGYSYLGPGGASNLHLLTYDNETDIGQHLTSFESTEMMSWFGEYWPGDSTWLFPGDSTMS
ncbi:fungal-specific transcription factor domain-containing protein [Annulohypoxylon maeteangense]|uniref:fungal-specific transcription factor domain-containing protein n=1 Tax=Annulohypoxylon maeteangense TaxID=1927788 RepID=UPI002007B14B|nr:fungal-specific transcription factor domain-containing protein [Annulohypoxylon maeteangense]KAI0885088.1 fungal-specific transcription factor domain-containing protein [Annulohypoxylon maeteangense]